MKKLLIISAKCDGCRECEAACIDRQSRAHKSQKRRKSAPVSFISIISAQKPGPLFPNPGNYLTARRPTKQEKTLPETAALESYHPLFCLHCDDAPCLEACISGAMRRDKKTGLVNVDREQCVGCWSCIMACPFGVITRGSHAMKCDGCPELPEPACAASCKPEALAFLTPQEFVKHSRRNATMRRKNTKCAMNGKNSNSLSR
ncbi:MAG: 4Fe-4S dicluster domain-containing protein [Planctomycetes bacterium]|nr:4Fe-4S dicluster domain-containing protein [Planctomycetota bacterium]